MAVHKLWVRHREVDRAHILSALSGTAFLSKRGAA